MSWCLSVRLYPINVKTAEPIGPNDSRECLWMLKNGLKNISIFVKFWKFSRKKLLYISANFFDILLNVQPISHCRIHSKSALNVVLKFIEKFKTVVMLHHSFAQKESCWDVRSFKGLNKIYENISKLHCRVISFLIILKKLLFIFNSR